MFRSMSNTLLAVISLPLNYNPSCKRKVMNSALVSSLNQPTPYEGLALS